MVKLAKRFAYGTGFEKYIQSFKLNIIQSNLSVNYHVGHPLNWLLKTIYIYFLLRPTVETKENTVDLQQRCVVLSYIYYVTLTAVTF